MNIFLLSRAEVEKTMGKKSVMTPNLLGMNLQGEKAFLITSPSMNEGYDLTIGFFNNKARYLVFKKKSSTRWNEADVRATLMQVGPFSNWSSKPASDFFDYLEKDGDKIVAEATAQTEPHSVSSLQSILAATRALSHGTRPPNARAL